jgi:hypothetical protein
MVVHYLSPRIESQTTDENRHSATLVDGPWGAQAKALTRRFAYLPTPSSFRTVPLVPGSYPQRRRIIEAKPA